VNLTLRIKGILALGVLILYIASMSWVLAYARQELYAIVQQMEANYAKQALLAPVFRTLAHSVVDTQEAMSLPDRSESRILAYRKVAGHMDAVREGLGRAQQLYPLLARDIDDLEQASASAAMQPDSAHLAEVRNGQQKLIAKLHDLLTALQERSAELARSYNRRQQYISAVAISANIVGAVASAAVILFFFTKLAKDIKRLQDRAVAIVAGYSGAPLVNSRRDEVGGLIDAVNRMQVDLRRWEQQQEISREQRFHQEKMAAVGSLAAAIGHEVSNPLAAIAGVTQVIIDETKDDPRRKASKLFHDFAVEIRKQTERIALIIGQMSILTTPPSPEPELLDLNALIQSTCGFICYDKRFRGVEIELDLNRELPAVTAIADHITQILMNLLINAADAMDQPADPARCRIRVTTRLAQGEIHLAIADTGHGMSAEVLARAFQESFTTKPAGKGRGIGLFLCKMLVEERGGRIELQSVPGRGTVANLYLPLSEAKPCPPSTSS
jgi:two-component system NtrC family sensor kinase